MTGADVKELIVVIVLAITVFWLAKPIALHFTNEQDFNRRRTTWLVLTVAAFVSPNFWVFVLVAAPVVIWSARRDQYPLSLYLLLFQVIPEIPVEIPAPAINELFPLTMYRLLSLFLLIPAALHLRRSRASYSDRTLRSIDIMLLIYGALQIVLFIHPGPDPNSLKDSFTSELRRAFLFFIDTYVVYFVASRSCKNPTAIRDALASFCLACSIMALIAIFESTRGWLLYTGIAVRWSGNEGAGFYLMRGNLLRAQASAGHALALGYLLAIALGFWIHLQRFIPSLRAKLGVPLLLWLGLLAAYSRGPWIGAFVIYITYILLSPRATTRMLKATFATLFVGALVIASPIGERIVTVIPFLGGSVDSGSIAYRKQIAERSLELIEGHPFFGDQYAISKMEDLRQGQGIIDLLNTYADVAVFYGLVGLFAFTAVALLSFLYAYSCVRRVSSLDPTLASLGVSIISCIVGTLVMIASCSFILGYQKMYFVLAGIALAYTRVCKTAEIGDSGEAEPPVVP